MRAFRPGLVAGIVFVILIVSLPESLTAISYNDPDSVISYYRNKIHPDSIESYMQALEDFSTRFCLASNRKQVALWIRDKFQSFGYENVVLDSFALNRWFNGVYYQTWQYNVVCTLNGYSDSDSVYILGAHYDSYVPANANPFNLAPGADDNASGTAATLEIARVIKQHNYQPAYKIIFIAFGAEELGLHGGWDYATKAYNSGMNIICMINNDMISHCTLPPEEWVVRLQKYPNSTFFNNLAHQIVNDHTILSLTESTQYLQSSDSWPFYQKGYQAVFFIEDDFTPYYHTVNDLVLSTNKYYAAEVTRISLGMLIYMNGLGYDPNSQVPNLFHVADTTIVQENESCFAASEMLIVGGGHEFIVLAGASAELVSGSCVSIREGAFIAENAYMHAHITLDNSYCLQPENKLLAGDVSTYTLNECTDTLINDLIRVYPNPTSGNLCIELNEAYGSETLVFHIFNCFGQLMEVVESTSYNTHTLNLAGLPPGIYLLRTRLLDSIVCCKVILK